LSALTKVFVVLLVVFSIAFTSMTVSFASRTPKWKEVAERYEEHARVADTNLRNLIAANAAELASATDTVNRHLRHIADLEARVKQAETEVARLEGELGRARSQEANLEATQRTTLALLQNAESESTEYRRQRGDLESQNIDLRQRNIDLNDRVNELTAGIDVLYEQNRQFEQQMNILKSENKRLSNRFQTPSIGNEMEAPAGMAMKKIQPRTPVTSAPIRGQILGVSGDIVTISVGTADGVERDMIFVIHRGEEYIGDLKISAVQPEKAAGRLKGAKLVPVAGDRVTDAIGMTASRR
jgi:TolA-binding protein